MGLYQDLTFHNAMAPIQSKQMAVEQDANTGGWNAKKVTYVSIFHRDFLFFFSHTDFE